jgi:hypothetical protein
MNPAFLATSLFLVCCLGSSASLAQDVILHLRNGDRITGHVLSEGTNGVEVATPFAGRVVIPTDWVERRENAPASTNQPPKAVNGEPKAPASGVVGELVLTNKPTMTQAAGGAAKPPETAPKPPEPSGFRKFLSQWRGEAQLGANLGYASKNREEFTGHIKLAHNYPLEPDRAVRNILEYDVSYGTTDSVLSNNKMDGRWKLEYDLTKRVLLYNNTDAGYDEIQGIDFQYNFGPGVGYKWVVLTNFVFKTELGGDYQKQYFIHEQTSSRYSLRLAEDLWWQIRPKIRWDEKVEFFPSVSDLSEYRVRVESNLSYLFKDNLTLTLNVIDVYDTAVPAGLSKNDLQIRSLLGVKF